MLVSITLYQQTELWICLFICYEIVFVLIQKIPIKMEMKKEKERKNELASEMTDTPATLLADLNVCDPVKILTQLVGLSRSPL